MAAAFCKQFPKGGGSKVFPQKNLESQMKQHLLFSVGKDTLPHPTPVLTVAGKSWD